MLTCDGVALGRVDDVGVLLDRVRRLEDLRVVGSHRFSSQKVQVQPPAQPVCAGNEADGAGGARGGHGRGAGTGRGREQRRDAARAQPPARRRAGWAGRTGARRSVRQIWASGTRLLTSTAAASPSAAPTAPNRGISTKSRATMVDSAASTL